MSPRDAVRALAFGRVVIGLVLLLAPRRAGKLMLGPDADQPLSSLSGRMVGARDIVLGAMTLHTVDHPQVAQRWIATCGAVDAVDFGAAVSARESLPFFQRIMFYLVAGGSALAHVALSRAIVSPEGLESVAAQTPPQPASSPETVYPDGADEAKRAMGARTMNVSTPGGSQPAGEEATRPGGLQQ